MTRREFFLATGGAAVAASQLNAQSASGYQPMGLNSYCLRALKWTDKQVLDYAAGLKLDGVFLQDSLDPDRERLEHLKEIGAYAKQLKLHLETGIGPVLPASPEAAETSRKLLLTGLERAKACGSPLMRVIHAGDRAHLPKAPMETNIKSMIQLLKSVQPQFQDAGIKIAIENHKDLQAWEMREVFEGAGKEWVGSYLDTGNPVFVAEDPLTTVETLGPYALCVHLRDSVIYESPGGAMVQWVPLGEGNIDFHAIVAKVREMKPDVYVYIKPITGRPAQLIPYLETDFWKDYPKARAAEFSRFLAIAKRGAPYNKPIVIEDLPGKVPEAFLSAVQFQQRDHMERSVEYGKKTLNLGRRWRV
jgi:3-oxoisoapionate decarboxylase